MTLETPIKTEQDLWKSCYAAFNERDFARHAISVDANEESTLYAYGPVARQNRFQAMLYSQSAQNHFHLLPITSFSLFKAIPWHGRFICHIHWLNVILKSCESLEEVRENVRAFDRLLGKVVDRGGLLVWTVHNIVPHVMRWPDEELEIHQLMSDHSHLIHMMTSETIPLCTPHYKIDPNKAFLVPHPSYGGSHEDSVTRQEAREKLGIRESPFVFLSFGAILPYKGYRDLMTCFERVATNSGRKVHLIIAGPPTDTELSQDLTKWVDGCDNVTLDLRTIPREEVQHYFRSADCAVCPYERTLNSGVALLALSFNLPIVAPRKGAFVDIVGDECGILYNSASEDLYNAMREAMTMDLDKTRTSITRRDGQYQAKDISTQFFRHIRKKLN